MDNHGSGSTTKSGSRHGFGRLGRGAALLLICTFVPIALAVFVVFGGRAIVDRFFGAQYFLDNKGMWIMVVDPQDGGDYATQYTYFNLSESQSTLTLTDTSVPPDVVQALRVEESCLSRVEYIPNGEDVDQIPPSPGYGTWTQATLEGQTFLCR